MKRAKRYRVIVKDTAGKTQVTVQDEKGVAETGDTAVQLLTLLDQPVR